MVLVLEKPGGRRRYFEGEHTPYGEGSSVITHTFQVYKGEKRKNVNFEQGEDVRVSWIDIEGTIRNILCEVRAVGDVIEMEGEENILGTGDPE